MQQLETDCVVQFSVVSPFDGNSQCFVKHKKKLSVQEQYFYLFVIKIKPMAILINDTQQQSNYLSLSLSFLYSRK